MTADLAHDYIRRRMEELGYGNKYHIRMRDFILRRWEQRTIKGGRQLFILIEPSSNIRVKSAMGVFDLTETTANELQYEHQGTIELTNYSFLPQEVKMIQLIFKNK